MTVAEGDAESEASGFSVSLSNFSGPFDLLLSLIGKHELDITEISLSRVTDEFISYLRKLDSPEELDQASEFLVVAATLLDLKVAGLLPQGELVDAEDCFGLGMNYSSGAGVAIGKHPRSRWCGPPQRRHQRWPHRARRPCASSNLIRCPVVYPRVARSRSLEADRAGRSALTNRPEASGWLLLKSPV